MPTKLADAIITGPMARPSSPSVRFTALPAPTMMKAPKIGKNQPRLMTMSLNTGNTSEVAKAGRPRLAIAIAGGERDRGLDREPAAMPAKPLWVCRVTLR